MSDKIDELLGKLRELDPDVYGAWCELFYEIYSIDYDCIEWDSFAGAVYLLQGLIQDAVAARGWNAELGIGERPQHAEVIDDQFNRYKFKSVNISEAILAAYVAALEATR